MAEPVEGSVLDSVKKVLGYSPEDDSFDIDIIMHLNSVFSTLHQLGVGPANGFSIEDNTAVWDDFIGATQNIHSVKSYVYLKVRMLFDPPATSFALTAMEKMATEYEWRLNVVVDNDIPAEEGV